MPAISAVPTEPPLSIKHLNVGTKKVTHVIFLDEPDRVLAVDVDGIARVYGTDCECTGEPNSVSNGHSTALNDIVLLEGGVLASVSQRFLFTFRAIGGKKLKTKRRPLGIIPRVWNCGVSRNLMTLRLSPAISLVTCIC